MFQTNRKKRKEAQKEAERRAQREAEMAARRAEFDRVHTYRWTGR